MRITNALVYNPEPQDGDQLEIKQGTAAPSTRAFFKNARRGTLYLRDVADGHVQVWQKVFDGDAANDWACLYGVIQESVVYADFTDETTALGHVDLANSIPALAIVDPISILDVTGFAGDTSATVQVGESDDLDRYSTGTPSVFATAAGVNAGAPSGTRFHVAAETPRVTVTKGSDWGTGTSGALTVRIPYHF